MIIVNKNLYKTMQRCIETYPTLRHVAQLKKKSKLVVAVTNEKSIKIQKLAQNKSKLRTINLTGVSMKEGSGN